MASSADPRHTGSRYDLHVRGRRKGHQRLPDAPRTLSAVMTIIVACTLLWYKAGYVMFAPLLFIVTLISSTSSISRFVGAAQKAWLKAVDVRIKLLVRLSLSFSATNEGTLTAIPCRPLPIKLGAYEAALGAKINALREIEIKVLGSFLYYISIAGTLLNIGGSASFLVTLAAYAVMLANGWGSLPPLDVSRVFTLFTIVNLLNGPLSSIGQTLPQLFASFASLGRIQGFLQLPEKPADSVDAVVDDVSADGIKESTVEVSLKGCTFAWDDKTHVLKDISLELAPRQLHMVVGSVASGKSSLLMSILEETTLVEGKVRVKAHKIALASQTPFIYPGTPHANILLDSPYDEAFCLRQDIKTLPRRDITKLGDKGTTLSGGQRQRLIYSSVFVPIHPRSFSVLVPPRVWNPTLENLVSDVPPIPSKHAAYCRAVKARSKGNINSARSSLRSFTHRCFNLLSFFLQVGAQQPSLHKSSHLQHPPNVRRSRKYYAILGRSLASSNIRICLKTGFDSKTSRASTFQDFKPSSIQLQAVKACGGLSVPAF
ncbi:hypothetical protein B0H14DRAFT_3177101 [Mycena olivaceomarginata]|nr:hypothetical protein B0H14DRAFT_3177101 [Mycena olivaceomarginata]